MRWTLAGAGDIVADMEEGGEFPVRSDDALNGMMVVNAETQVGRRPSSADRQDQHGDTPGMSCPLLDQGLVEFAATIPEEVKIRRGRLKYAMKTAFYVLPADILERKKRGFGTPMGAWLKADLKPLLARMLDESVVKQRGLFEYKQIRPLVADHQANGINGTDQLLSLMNLEIWSRIYPDRRVPEDVALQLHEAVV